MAYAEPETTGCGDSTIWDKKDANVADEIEKCLKGTSIAVQEWNLNVIKGTGFKEKVNKVIAQISQILGIIAVWALVYGWYLLVFSAGEEESIKKGKDIVKWTLIWFLALIFSGTIVLLVINFIYSIS